MNNYELHTLKSFLTAYFHEDWALEASSAEQVLEDFLEETPDDSLKNEISKQIELYVRSNSVIDASHLLHDLGCYYDPTSDGMDPVDWLLFLSSRLRLRP